MYGLEQASIALLMIISATYADVSHLNGYHYPNLGANALHTPQAPAPTQYQPTYGDNLVSKNLPTSYGNIYTSKYIRSFVCLICVYSINYRVYSIKNLICFWFERPFIGRVLNFGVNIMILKFQDDL